MSARQILDVFAALDAISNDENQRYFNSNGALSVEESRRRLGALFGLNEEQISAIGHALAGNKQAAQTIWGLRNFLINEVFSFIKCFEAERSFEDEQNYYMEREWRLADNLQFKLDDVSHIFIPAAYARRLRADLPEYVGQISFVE